MLVLLLVVFVASPFLEEIDTKFPAMSFVILGSIILTLRTLDLPKKRFRLCVTIGSTALFSNLVFRLADVAILKDIFGTISLIVYALFYITSIVLMLQKLFTSSKVTGDTIVGGICVYLLIGFFWSMLYYLIYVFDNNGFYFSEHWDYAYLIYLSFTTLTTLGYGDIYPINRMAMVFANLEALVGQLYLTVFVARLIGLHLIHHQSQQHHQS